MRDYNKYLSLCQERNPPFIPLEQLYDKKFVILQEYDPPENITKHTEFCFKINVEGVGVRKLSLSLSRLEQFSNYMAENKVPDDAKIIISFVEKRKLKGSASQTIIKIKHITKDEEVNEPQIDKNKLKKLEEALGWLYISEKNKQVYYRKWVDIVLDNKDLWNYINKNEMSKLVLNNCLKIKNNILQCEE